MICDTCKKAADANRELKILSLEKLKSLHDSCDYPATCPCLHRLDAQYKEIENA